MPLSFMAAPTSVDADAPILEAPERRRDAFVDRFFRAAKPLGSRLTGRRCTWSLKNLLTGDMVGLVDALGQERAVIIGHDWGAAVAWHCALLRPDLFSAVVLLSVPYLQRSWADLRPTERMKLLAGEKHFYQLYFQEPGRAEAELEADVRRTMCMMLYSASGDPPPEKRWRFLFNKSETFLDTGTVLSVFRRG
jgi:pimeloyl-ACP methyl ester carboxylesterase